MVTNDYANQGVAARRGRQWVKWLFLLLVLCLALASATVLCLSPNPSEARLPEASQVKSMRAKLYNFPKKLPDVLEFEVPAEHVPRILGALAPYKRDPSPKKWQVLGDLKLACMDGMEVTIHLYWTGAETGAFSVGPYGDNVYFRGGTDNGIESAIRDARREAEGGKPDDSR